jgi:hypothetical protein
MSTCYEWNFWKRQAIVCKETDLIRTDQHFITKVNIKWPSNWSSEEANLIYKIWHRNHDIKKDDYIIFLICHLQFDKCLYCVPQ